VARETRELARVAVALPDRLLWLAEAQGAPPGLLYQPAMADRLIPHATASGKAWLAGFDDAAALALARAGGLGAPGPTARTITDADALLRELARVRRRGWALAEQEAEPGVIAVAVAIGRPARGTLSVAGPAVRLGPAQQRAAAAALAGAARELAAVWPAAPVAAQQRA
jgi:DNA-binding IclR family transcriptional regulator